MVFVVVFRFLMISPKRLQTRQNTLFFRKVCALILRPRLI